MEVSFIPFRPELFSQHLYYSLGALIVLPVIISLYYDLIPPETILVKIIGISLSITLLILFIQFRINAHKTINQKAEQGALREGLFMLKELMVYKKRNQCKLIYRNSIREIRIGWVLNPDGADERGVIISYFDSTDFEFVEEYFNEITSEKMVTNLLKWVKSGHFPKIK